MGSILTRKLFWLIAITVLSAALKIFVNYKRYARVLRYLTLSLFVIGNNRSIMKKKVNGRMSNTLGWITTIAMSIAAAALLLTLGAGQ